MTEAALKAEEIAADLRRDIAAHEDVIAVLEKEIGNAARRDA